MKQFDPKSLTFCYGCVFAKTKRNKQTGCKIKQLSNFANKVLKEYEGSSYYVGEPKCAYYRTKEWKYATASIKKKQIFARKEICVPIYINIEYENQDSSLLDTVNSINSQILQPKFVNIYVNFLTSEEQMLNIIDVCKKLKSLYKIHFMLEAQRNLREFIIQSNKETFLLFIKCGTLIQQELLSNIDISINDLKQKFYFIWTDSDDIFFILRPFYELQFPKTLYDIVQEYRSTQPSFGA